MLDLIKRKGKGEEIEVGERPRQEAEVVDLFEALKNSLDSARKPRRRTAKKTTAKCRRAS